MTSPILVVPPAEHILCRLQQYALVIRLNDERDIDSALKLVSGCRLNLHGLWVETSTPLGAIELRESWAGAGIALHVPSAGSYREVRHQLPLLRRLGLRVYLPATTEDNVLAARILASLSVPTAVVLKGSGVLWEPLAGLTAYALLGSAPRETIEPFHYIASSYRADRPVDYSAVYFDDPRVFRHIDEDGRIALTTGDARRKRFVADSIDMLSDLEQSQRFIERAEAWQSGFTRRPDVCASCEAWRVCLGKFAADALRDSGCRKYFVGMIDVVERSQTQVNRGRHPWPSHGPDA